MSHWLRDAKLAVVSILCVFFALVLLAFDLVSGVVHRLGATGDHVVGFFILSPCLIGAVLAIAALRWDRRKSPAAIALIFALASAGLIFARVTSPHL